MNGLGKMRRFVRLISLGVVFVWGVNDSMIGTSKAEDGDTDVALFRDQVRPVLERYCVECHNGTTRKGEFDLSTRAAAIVSDAIEVGDADSSYLIDLIESDDPDTRMPKKRDALSAEQILLLRKWVDDGAEWPDDIVLEDQQDLDATWWSLQPLPVTVPPDVVRVIATKVGKPGLSIGHLKQLASQWNRNPIDRFILAKLLESGLSPSPPATRREWIRRVTYDLTGLPPTPKDIQSFLRDDTATAYEKVVDRLLASPRYGEQWGRHWLDVARFGESNGFERNVLINNVWPYRDYVIRSFNSDKPFPTFVMEQLAGDVTGPGDPDVEIGTAFLTCGPYDNVGNQDAAQAAQIRANTVDEMIRATSETFLGMTIGCARCHNHKFDPVTQRDYYGLYATLAGTYHGNREVATDAERKKRSAQLRPLNVQRQEVVKQRNSIEREIRERAEVPAAEVEAGWTRPAISRKGTSERFTAQTVEYVRLIGEGLDTNPAARAGFRIDEFEIWTTGPSPRNVALASAGATADGASRIAQDFAGAYSAGLAIDGRFGARWIASSPTLTVHLARPTEIDSVLFSSDRDGSAGGHSVATFLCEYRIEVSQDGKQWTEVANSHDRKPVNDAHRKRRLYERARTDIDREQLNRLNTELAAVDAKIREVKPLPNWWVPSFREAEGPFFVFLGGDPQRHGRQVTPGSLEVLQGAAGSYRLDADQKESDRRLALARWIVRPDNPLTPRVLANRVWHYHFGTGIVDTPSDFGRMGGRPSHPELLDWLAHQLVLPSVRSNDDADERQGREMTGFGWRIKPLHKLIVLSQTYRQSSSFRPRPADLDRDSRWLWRFPPRRLTAEEIRDTLLSISGQLKHDGGGPGFRLYEYLQDNVATYVPLNHHGSDTYRRSVYHQNARAAPVDLTSEFDSPDCAFAVPRRSSTTTPLQALTLLNHSFTLDMAQAFADRLQTDTARRFADPGRLGDDQIRAKVERAYELAYGRPADDGEVHELTEFIHQFGWVAACRVLLNANELIYLY